MSTTSTPSITGAEKTSAAAESGQQPEEIDEYADAEKNYQPKTLKFWSIMIGMYISIFLVALVSLLPPMLSFPQPKPS